MNHFRIKKYGRSFNDQGDYFFLVEIDLGVLTVFIKFECMCILTNTKRSNSSVSVFLPVQPIFAYPMLLTLFFVSVFF